jgi:sugar phosphate isomerase/epimerase
MRASLGAFLHLTCFEPERWQEQLVELRDLKDRGHVEVWFEWLPSTAAESDAVRGLLSGERVVVHAPFIGMSIGSHWPELVAVSVDRIVETCRIAEDLKAEVVTIHSGIVSVFEQHEAVLDRIAGAYETIQAQAGGLTVALENMYNGRGITAHGAASIADLLALSQRVPTMKFTLDIGHAIQSKDQYRRFLLTKTPAIANIHLHDGFADGTAHLRLGDGQLDLADFAISCVDAGYDQFIGLETIGAADTAASWVVLQEQLAALGV